MNNQCKSLISNLDIISWDFDTGFILTEFLFSHMYTEYYNSSAHTETLQWVSQWISECVEDVCESKEKENRRKHRFLFLIATLHEES